MPSWHAEHRTPSPNPTTDLTMRPITRHQRSSPCHPLNPSNPRLAMRFVCEAVHTARHADPITYPFTPHVENTAVRRPATALPFKTAPMLSGTALAHLLRPLNPSPPSEFSELPTPLEITVA